MFCILVNKLKRLCKIRSIYQCLTPLEKETVNVYGAENQLYIRQRTTVSQETWKGEVIVSSWGGWGGVSKG